MTTPIGAELLSPAVQQAKKDLLLQFREPININNDDAQYKVLEVPQNKYVKNNGTLKDPSVFSTVECFCRLLYQLSCLHIYIVHVVHIVMLYLW